MSDVNEGVAASPWLEEDTLLFTDSDNESDGYTIIKVCLFFQPLTICQNFCNKAFNIHTLVTVVSFPHPRAHGRVSSCFMHLPTRRVHVVIAFLKENGAIVTAARYVFFMQAKQLVDSKNTTTTPTKNPPYVRSTCFIAIGSLCQLVYDESVPPYTSIHT